LDAEFLKLNLLHSLLQNKLGIFEIPLNNEYVKIVRKSLKFRFYKDLSDRDPISVVSK